MTNFKILSPQFKVMKRMSLCMHPFDLCASDFIFSLDIKKFSPPSSKKVISLMKAGHLLNRISNSILEPCVFYSISLTFRFTYYAVEIIDMLTVKIDIKVS